VTLHPDEGAPVTANVARLHAVLSSPVAHFRCCISAASIYNAAAMDDVPR
jgi:hypothetical protein